MRLNLAVIGGLLTATAVHGAMHHHQKKHQTDCHGPTRTIDLLAESSETTSDKPQMELLSDLFRTMLAAKFTSPQETTIVSPPAVGPNQDSQPIPTPGATVGDTNGNTAAAPVPTPSQISDTARNYRLRAQSSVNLGGWLVTEKWLKPGLYECTGNEKVGELNLAANCETVSR